MQCDAWFSALYKYSYLLTPRTSAAIHITCIVVVLLLKFNQKLIKYMQRGSLGCAMIRDKHIKFPSTYFLVCSQCVLTCRSLWYFMCVCRILIKITYLFTDLLAALRWLTPKSTRSQGASLMNDNCDINVSKSWELFIKPSSWLGNDLS